MVFLTEDWRPRRSVLFMPASNQKALGKAYSLACDGLIFDLEDSVGPQEQEAARDNLLRWVRGGDFGGRERVIRISAAGTAERAGDLRTAIECGVDAILLPKVEMADELVETAGELERAGSSSRLWAMVETPRALIGLGAIAAATPRLQGLVVGPNDLAKSTGVPMRPGRLAMIPWFMQVIAAARAHGLFVLDGVYNNFRDADGLAAECAQGAELGFDGKTLIHPAQIAAANAAFSPSDAEISRARAIVALFGRPENAGRGALQLDGEMVERLHLESARLLLAAFGGGMAGGPAGASVIEVRP